MAPYFLHYIEFLLYDCLAGNRNTNYEIFTHYNIFLIFEFQYFQVHFGDKLFAATLALVGIDKQNHIFLLVSHVDNFSMADN